MNPVFPDFDLAVYRETYSNWRISERVISNHELVFVFDGIGNTKIEETVYHLIPGTVIYYPPGVKHSLWVNSEPYMKFYCFHFALTNSSEVLPLPNVIYSIVMEYYLPLLKQLYTDCRTEDPFTKWESTLIISTIIKELEKTLYIKKTPAETLYTKKMLSYIKNNYTKKLTLEDLGCQTGLSKTSVCRLIKQATGKSPIEYLLHLRIEYAKELLSGSNLKVREVSDACGFSDPFYFSKVFKRMTHKSPSEYIIRVH